MNAELTELVSKYHTYLPKYNSNGTYYIPLIEYIGDSENKTDYAFTQSIEIIKYIINYYCLFSYWFSICIINCNLLK